MNKTLLYKAMFIASKQFKLIWGLITLAALVCSLHLTYQGSYNYSYKDVAEIANDLSKNMDGMIEDLFQEVYTLPIYGKNISGCPSDLSNDLQRISYNNTNISGLIVSNLNHQVICSTISPHTILDTNHNKRARMLIGPFALSLYDQPIYLIRQKIGPYYIDIIIVASLLKENLETSNSWINSIVLYNATDKKNLLKIQRSEDSNNWIFSTHNSTEESSDIEVTEKLQSIDGVAIRVFANNKILYHHILLEQIIAALLTLVISYILYGLINHNINRHYSLKEP